MLCTLQVAIGADNGQTEAPRTGWGNGWGNGRYFRRSSTLRREDSAWGCDAELTGARRAF
jgi:hypothetical protein